MRAGPELCYVFDGFEELLFLKNSQTENLVVTFLLNALHIFMAPAGAEQKTNVSLIQDRILESAQDRPRRKRKSTAGVKSKQHQLFSQ